MIDEDKYIWISNEIQLNNLIEDIKGKKLFGKQFKFSERELFLILLEKLEIDYDEFEKKYFYFDYDQNKSISESQFNYVWISTQGLRAKGKATSSKKVNSCISQYVVVSLLIDKAIKITQSSSVYDIDSYEFDYLSELSLTLYHNVLFYIEVFCKAYLSLTGIDIGNTHQLKKIYKKTVETMNMKKHNNSFFQAKILHPLLNFIEHIDNLPGDFKEQFVKYDDNPEDDTIIVFRTENLLALKTVFAFSNDFIYDYLHKGDECSGLKSGFYQELLDRANTEEEKNKIREKYKYLNVSNK